MASVQSLPELLNTLTSSLNTLTTTLPSVESIVPPADGISLLNTKNELFLSYLQNLVFLILLKVRNTKAQLGGDEVDQGRSVFDDVVKKLVELRVYLDRGVKPLEAKLRYQIDKAVRAANDHEAKSQRAKNPNGLSNGKSSKTKAKSLDVSSDDSSESDEESGVSGSESDTAAPVSQSNLASFARPSAGREKSGSNSKDKSGVYRPPRIAPVAPPTADGSSRQARRPAKSRVLDEYITSELSVAPMAEPSIGANIVDRGRRDILSARERKVTEDRQRYEEENLVRLPGMGKKEKRRLEGERAKRGQFGGEEWSGLGGSADRIVELTKRSSGGGGAKGALERSRKRGRDEDRGESNGYTIGESFERKRRQLERRSGGKRK